MSRRLPKSIPPAGRRGLYDPFYEHDACGVGFIAHMKGRKSHDLIDRAIEILINLTHRGACGCDDNTGDGAGIMLQTPDKFFRRVMAERGVKLPAASRYGVGMVFLPPGAKERGQCVQIIDMVVAREGGRVLGWRDVPTDNSMIGWVARAKEPHTAQVFIGGFDRKMDTAAIERRLYVIRRAADREIRESSIRNREYFYWVTVSSRTIVYKGLLLAPQIKRYYPDLADPDFESALCLVHQRYSTNTFPSWELAHPFRFLCHNGEINTLRGNINWMKAREELFRSPLFGDDIKKLSPVIREGVSDSAAFDNALELLVATGRSLPHAVMMMIPEAWERHDAMTPEKRAFYEYHASLMEPWDGPASIAFSDGQVVGAVLDRNGLRPSRYWVTKDDLVIMASETGVLEVAPEDILLKGRLQPGRMFLVDLEEGRIIPDEEIKAQMAARQPYAEWIKENLRRLENLPEPPRHFIAEPFSDEERLHQLRAFGYTQEDLRIILGPMTAEGKEPVGSMGNDIPLAVLSERPQLLYNYFKQLFAQVTNPPLDAIREELVTAMRSTLGSEQDLFTETPLHAHQLALPHPILTETDVAKIKALDEPGLKTTTLSTLFPAGSGGEGLRQAMDDLCARSGKAVREGATLLILSDRGVDRYHAPIPALLACAGVHHHLIRTGQRTRCGLIVESAEPREVHHFSLLVGYGAGAIHPYLALEVVREFARQGAVGSGIDAAEAVRRYVEAINAGILKVMSKMGISTLASYRGAQIFEAVGLNSEVIDHYFTWTASRIQGVGLDAIAEETGRRHELGFPSRLISGRQELENGGVYQYRRDGEYHMINPETVARLQQATRVTDRATARRSFEEFSRLVDDQNRRVATLRGLMAFKWGETPVPIEEVEPAEAIVRRFVTGAMSFGSISAEAHETLAIAMNRIGGKSNTGEGGEDPRRFKPDPGTGDWRRSAIKQVASARFGVTSEYLVNADELQIKMAQGAKPGEGGQLPAKKVYPWIARVRHSTPFVGLISPPPHHDIYSIEDLAQLIYDLKNANRGARINVKLVSEVGVGTIAAGVAKGHADVVLISGDTGGTGASPQTSIKHAGLPWELGLAETHQVLVRNRLRGRIVVQTDGQLKTARDVAIACLLGAEEFGFSTAPLITLGCIMMRKCHLDTCPVGIATQNPELRRKFAGKPDYVINYFFLLAESLREIMARLGFRKIEEMVGRADRLDARQAVDHWKARGIDLSAVLAHAVPEEGVATYCCEPQNHGLEASLDVQVLLELCRPAIERGEPARAELPIRNIHRTVGTITGSELTRRWGSQGLPDDTIRLLFRGSAGQSFAAFTPRGMTFLVEGDANDYFGKGLSGARVIIYPPRGATFRAEENIIIGNVAFYGATSGEAYVRGLAGERFCVRNSGLHAVVEGVGDHGCEYMTGGRVVVIGPTGRNFAAGMSGGIAYVLDEDDSFERRCNREMVELEELSGEEDVELVLRLLRRHADFTGSTVAQRILRDWRACQARFVRVMAIDYKRALAMGQFEAQPEPTEPARLLAGA